MDDLSQVGYVPLNIRMERIALLNPFGRRVLVLLGASGTGRRTLKSMLLERFPNHFATTVPGNFILLIFNLFFQYFTI